MFLKCEIGNGKEASFWWVSWTDLGPLRDFIGHRGPRMLRLSLEARVSEAVRNGDWFLPNARSEEVQELQIKLTALTPPGPDRGEDKYLWRTPAGTYGNSFSSKGTWEQLRNPSPQLGWTKLVWFKEAVPRASFILWLVCLEQETVYSNGVCRCLISARFAWQLRRRTHIFSLTVGIRMPCGWRLHQRSVGLAHPRT
ncbi:unnamed protein product [Microthlaspi erraticum]|uniref:Reverse transcriptase zinc-binding domain-containing protein n=1 Tax=Microthlaspi erraticum TaxID=1685480 RepID=A0A6D2JVA3_9BRAS|nr:unnamed protein product [Microthlaspi erraticum]